MFYGTFYYVYLWLFYFERFHRKCLYDIVSVFTPQLTGVYQNHECLLPSCGHSEELQHIDNNGQHAVLFTL